MAQVVGEGRRGGGGCPHPSGKRDAPCKRAFASIYTREHVICPRPPLPYIDLWGIVIHSLGQIYKIKIGGGGGGGTV
jgi:hypothetical protein